MGGSGFAQRIRLVHYRLELAAENVLQNLMQFAHCAHVGTEERELLGEEYAEIELGFGPSSGTAGDEASAGFEGFDALVPCCLAHVFEDDIHPSLGGDLLYFVRDLF